MFVMRGILLVVILLMALLCPTSAFDNNWTGSVSEHSFIHLSGYMDEMKIYQTHKGFEGQKLAYMISGTGTITRTQDAFVYPDELYYHEWAVLDYRPYLVESSESDLRTALCAKNYAMGTVISESYSDLTYLIKDTTIYQDDNVSVYQIGSHFRGTAKIGARVKDGPKGASVMIYGGTYIGDVMIREEIGVGDAFYLTCP